MMVRTLAVLVCTATLAHTGSAQNSLPDRSDHQSINVVPAPGKVKVDGVLAKDEWDPSGRIHVYPSKNIRHRVSVDVMTMWDAENLYVGLHFKDPTPLVNNVNAQTTPFDGWHSDSTQFRFVTQGEGVQLDGGKGYKAIHLDAFYSSLVDHNSSTFSHHVTRSPKSLVFVGRDKSHVDEKTGYAIAFRKDDDGLGYVQEMRIPWSLLYEERPGIKEGLRFRFVGEYYWGTPAADKWPQIFYQDPMSRPDRINTYKSPQNWGIATLVGKGNLKTDEPSVEDLDPSYVPPVAKAQGVVPIRFEVPASAKKFTVAIEGDEGVRFRNLVGNEDIDAYVVGRNGDKKIVEVLWDGRASSTFNYDWDEFVGYPAGATYKQEDAIKTVTAPNMRLAEPGAYKVRVLVHDGLKAYHVGAFYNSGNPAWPSESGSGGWLGDHHPPNDVAALRPGAKSQRGAVFMSSPGCECGLPLLGIDKKGEKIWGWQRQTSKVFCIGADEKYLYHGFSYSGRIYWGRINPDTGKQVPFAGGDTDLSLPEGKSFRFTGITARDGVVAIGLGDGGISLHDRETGQLTRHFKDLKHIHRLAFSGDGKSLFGLQTGKLVKVRLETGTIESLSVLGVDKIAALTTDSRGLLYVSDPRSSTVKVFDDKTLKQVAEIGEPGGREAGPFKKLRMHAPVALVVEERDDGVKRLWCVEQELAHHKFRRQTVWDVTDIAKVAYHRDYIGNAGYQGSGGSLSDDDPTLGLYRGALFRLDYAKATYDPIEIIPGAGGGHDRTFGNGFHFASSVSGKEREYYTEHCNIWVKTANGWKSAGSVAKLVSQGVGWGFRCNKNLEWHTATGVLRPVRFDDDGAPIYGRAEPLPGEAGSESASPRHEVIKTQFGYAKQHTHFGTNPLRVTWHYVHLHGYDKEGRYRWKYPMFWYGVHGCSTAPLSRPGRVMGFIKFLGTVDIGDHTYIGFRGYKGQDFFIRDDGLYVGELFRDHRETEEVLPDDRMIQGRDISNTTLSEECYSGWLGKQRDGKVRLTYGHTDVRIAEVRGLETARELPPFSLAVSAADVEKIKAFTPSREEKTRSFVIAKGGPFDAETVSFDKGALELKEVTRDPNPPRALLRYDDKNLYLAWHVKDETPWQHGPDGFQTLFKSGDAVEFFFDLNPRNNSSGIGGARIVLASPDGKDSAVVHRPHGPGGQFFTYESPVRKVTFRHVAVEPTIRFKAKKGDGQYVVTAAIPWDVIGLTPTSGARFKGDLGVVFGREVTTHVRAVVRWMAPPHSVQDLPTESEFFPGKFGVFVLE